MAIYRVYEFAGRTPYHIVTVETVEDALDLIGHEVGERHLIVKRWEDGSYSVRTPSRKLLPFTIQEIVPIGRG
jgi:hypothetical protein